MKKSVIIGIVIAVVLLTVIVGMYFLFFTCTVLDSSKCYKGCFVDSDCKRSSCSCINKKEIMSNPNGANVDCIAYECKCIKMKCDTTEINRNVSNDTYKCYNNYSSCQNCIKDTDCKVGCYDCLNKDETYVIPPGIQAAMGVSAPCSLNLYCSCKDNKCVSTDNDEVKLNSSFKLKINNSIIIPSENLKIKFLKVVENSLCPKGAQCIWRGIFTSELELNKNSVNLGKFNVSDDKEYIINNYKIRILDIFPENELNKSINVSDYEVTYFIDKK